MFDMWDRNDAVVDGRLEAGEPPGSVGRICFGSRRSGLFAVNRLEPRTDDKGMIASTASAASVPSMPAITR
jgi:hypothetical protein